MELFYPSSEGFLVKNIQNVFLSGRALSALRLYFKELAPISPDSLRFNITTITTNALNMPNSRDHDVLRRLI